MLEAGGDYGIGSPQTERGWNWYAPARWPQGRECGAVRTLRWSPLRWLAMPSPGQWRAVAELPQVEKELKPTPAHRPDGLWETHAQPGALPVDSVS